MKSEKSFGGWLIDSRRVLSRSPLYMRIARGVLWTMLGNFSWRLMSAISTIAVARILGPLRFGEYGLVQSTVQIFAAYAGAKMGSTSSKYVAQYRSSDPERAARILRLVTRSTMLTCLIGSGGMVVLAAWIASDWLDRPSLAVAVAIAGPLMFFLVFGNMQEAALTSFENFRAGARVNAIRGLTTPLLCIPLAYLYGVEGALVGLTMVAAIAFVQLGIRLRDEERRAGFRQDIGWREMLVEHPVLWRFALPGVLSLSVVTIANWYGRLVIAGSDHGFAELGIYEAANQWRMLILFLPVVLSRVLLPVLSETHARDSLGDFRVAVGINFRMVLLVTLPICVALVTFARPLAALFGSDFTATELVIPLIMASVFLFSLNQAVKQVYDSVGRRWTNMIMYMCWAIILLTGASVWVPQYGAIGFALSHVLAELMLLFLQAGVVELFIARGVLRRQVPLFAYGSAVIAAAVATQQLTARSPASSVLAALLALASILPVAKGVLQVRHGR